MNCITKLDLEKKKSTKSIVDSLKNTPKGKLTYKRNFVNENDETTNLYFQEIAKKLENVSFKEENETDFKNIPNRTFTISNNSNQTFTIKNDTNRKLNKSDKTREIFKLNLSDSENISPNISSTSLNSTKLDKIDQLSIYEKQIQLKNEDKINNLINNLKDHLNDINEESNIKLSEIRQSYFILKLKWFEKYNNDFDNLFNQAKIKINEYHDESVKAKLEKAEKERLRLQEEANKLKAKKEKQNEQIQKEISKQNQANQKEISKQNENLEKKSEKKLEQEKIKNEKLKINDDKKTDLSAESKKSTIKTETKLTTKLEDLNGFASQDDLKFYIDTLKFKIDIEKSIQKFSNDSQFRAQKTNLSLFIKTTVNSLSSNSQEHIRDKIERFSNLFSGKIIEFRDKPLSIQQDKDAFNYCIYHTANSFLTSGLKQVLSSTKSAFTFAQVLISLWIRFEDFGKILLAFFFEMCPYLVPYYPVRDSNDSEAEFKIACGYSMLKDNTIEDESVFLNKMRALTKLYAAMILIDVPNNPLNAKTGWKWLASILNLGPKSSVSPATIHAFISMTDRKLKSIYRKQFFKLLIYIKNIYLPIYDQLNIQNPQAKVQLETCIDGLTRTF